MRLVGTMPDGTEKEIKFRDCGELKRQDRNGEKCYVTEFIVDGLIKDSVTPVKRSILTDRVVAENAVLRAFGFVKVVALDGDGSLIVPCFDDTMEKVSV